MAGVLGKGANRLFGKGAQSSGRHKSSRREEAAQKLVADDLSHSGGSEFDDDEDEDEDEDDSEDDENGDDEGDDLRQEAQERRRKEEEAKALEAMQNQVKERNVYDYIPEEFLLDPKKAEPILHYLPKLTKRAEMEDEPESIPLNDLLTAAEEDVRLHRARIRAGMEKDQRLLRSYQLETDPKYQDRQTRLAERSIVVREVQKASEEIMKDFDEMNDLTGMTQAERAQVQLQRWQRALELYIFTPQEKISWVSLFEKLLEGIAEDQDMSNTLSQALEICANLLKSTKQTLADTAANVFDLEPSYNILLQAHQIFARGNLVQVADIEEQFKSSGRSALQIGHQLEHAEMKRSRCEAASILIRRWWILESLAEQEAATGKPIDVKAEIMGQVPPDNCRMDELFTRPDHSIEASRALKSLRAVVRSRGSVAASSSAPGTGIRDKVSSKRFDMTTDLIARTNEALEERLLTTFSSIYKASNIYDFSIKPRPGSVDWRELRSLAEALLLFDSGRKIQKKYVDLVTDVRFPELFQSELKAPDAEEKDFDLEETRNELSSLFQRVSEVCTAEFELIGHVFGVEENRTELMEGSDEMSLIVSRSLLQRIVSDQKHGLQARINDLLDSVDRDGDYETGSKKLDTFVVIHEKAAGLFTSLREAADKMIPKEGIDGEPLEEQNLAAAKSAVDTLKGFLTSQELALSNTHRQAYVNLELRVLHYRCCENLDVSGCTLVKGPPPRPSATLAERGILEDYRAPVLPLHKETLSRIGYTGILAGALNPQVIRQPLINAADSLSRARLMFGTSRRGGETTSRVILSIYSQMCTFYGEGYLHPIMETLREMLPTNPPAQPPQLPFDEDEMDAPDMGLSPSFWVALERVLLAAQSFDRELWGENRIERDRVWETLKSCGDVASQAIAREERAHFYSGIERRGEAAIVQSLDTICTYVQWILITGGESMLATGGSRILSQLTGSSGGPYSIPSGASWENPNSPAVKSLVYCLKVQFIHVQTALSPQQLASYWTALSMRLYDILVARLLQHYLITQVGAIILSRDVESLRSVSVLSGTDHDHWDILRELLTLYITSTESIKVLLAGPEGDVGKGLFAKAGRDKTLVFLSRRSDYRYKSASGPRKNTWVTQLLKDLNTSDPTDGPINIGLFAAGRKG